MTLSNKPITLSTLSDSLKDFDFSNGERYIFSRTYDIREEDGIESLDQDSANAAACVEELGLSYDINSRHYYTVVNGDHITEMVAVTWVFWRG